MAEQLIHQNVDAAQKEARDRGNSINRSTVFQASVECPHVRLCHGFVARDREQQGDIDVDAFEEQLLDCGHAGWGAWNLDEEVGTINARP